MRYVIFPSAYYPDGTRPSISSLFADADIEVIHGPTESGLYLIEGDLENINLLQSLSEPFYILFEDFDSHPIH